MVLIPSSSGGPWKMRLPRCVLIAGRRRGRRFAVVWLCLLGAVALTGCGEDGGGSGGGGSKPDDPPSDEDGDDDLGLRTDVGFKTFSYETPLLSSCLKGRGVPKIPTVPADQVTIDGDDREWRDESFSVDDPQDDAPGRGDVTQARLVWSDESLVLSFDRPEEGSVQLQWEFGGAMVREGRWLQQLRRRFRLRGGVLEDWRDGAYRPVSNEDAQWEASEDRYEVRLDQRLLGDAVTWPAWWIKVATRDTTHVLDESQAAFFENALGGDKAPLLFSGCTEWAGRKGSFSFVHITERADAASQGGSSFPLEMASQRAFQLVRRAFDAVVRLIGEKAVPVTRMAVVATRAQVSDRVGSLAGLPARKMSPPGLAVHIEPLDPASTHSFPQAPVFRRAALRFVDLALKARNPRAPAALRHFVGRALVENLIRRHFGKSYWLDSLRPPVERFLEFAERADSPTPLPARYERLKREDGFADEEQRASYRAVTQAKTVALGRLVAGAYTGDQLWRIWNAAADIDGSTPSEALRKAFLEDPGSEKGTAFAGGQPLARGEELVAGLWAGWVTGETYRSGFGPGAFSDPDADGLPEYLETIFATDPAKGDTDGDGWSDMAEVLLGTEPGVGGEKPTVIVPDGRFGDWLDLLPERIHGDKGRSRGCPKAADITHVGALASRDELIIGGYARNFDKNGPKARWEAVVDFPGDDRQLRLTAGAGRRVYQVKDAESDRVVKNYVRAFPLGREVFEVALERMPLGLDKHWDEEDAVRVRLRTVFQPEEGEAKFCDESRWFSAAISR